MVDATLHNTLFLFEQELDGWQISNPDEEIDSIANISDGLSGELYSSNGWIKNIVVMKIVNETANKQQTD